MKILCYHSVKNADNFEKQISYLARQYNVIGLQDFLAIQQGTRPDTSNTVMITFDDGDRTVLTHAAPILKKYNCKAVLFVITGLLGTSTPFWWDEIMYYTQDIGKVREIKKRPNNERLALIDSLRSNKELMPLTYPQLSVSELKTLEGYGIDIANHSHTHPLFDQTERPDLQQELEQSIGFLKSNGFAYWNVFAFPNGGHLPWQIDLLKENGITAAFLFDHQIADLGKSRFLISRLSVNDHTPMWKLKLILSGLHSGILQIRKKWKI